MHENVSSPILSGHTGKFCALDNKMLQVKLVKSVAKVVYLPDRSSELRDF